MPLGPIAVAVAAAAAAVHLAAWYANARRFAVGLDGPLWFVGSAEWTPPLGWVPWLLLAAAGSALLVVATAAAARAERGERGYESCA